ncbi:MAG: hypothetical protein LUQ57_06960 [Methylococcaceae bacterium]|nr:hypothetical protein [Methylococcaceae bacterium]
MYELIILLFNICRFKKGPEDLPYSLTLLKITVAAFAAVRFLMHYSGGHVLSAFLETGAEIVYIGLFSGVMLYVNRHLNRFYQVASAFFGGYALIGFLALPAVAAMLAGQPGGIAFIMLIGITAWFCAVTAHIVYHALTPNLFMSLGWALVFLVGFVLLAMSFGHENGIG